MKNFEKYFFGVIFLLLPFSIVSGSFLPDVTIVIFSIYFLFNYKFIKKFLKKFKFLYIIIFFWLIISFESLFSKYFYHSFSSSIVYVRFLLGSLGISVFLIKNNEFLKYFAYSLYICFLILIIDGFYQYYFGVNLIGMSSDNPNRLSSFFGDELILGSFLSRLTPLLFFFIFYYKKIYIINIYSGLVFLIFIDILTFFTGERVAFGYITLSTILMIFLLKKYKIYRLITFSLSIIIIIFLVSVSEKLKERMIDKTIHEMGLTSQPVIDEFTQNESNDVYKKITTDKFYAFTPHHQSHYDTALKMFKSKPFIGNGTKTFRFECKKINPKSCSTHPHNTYIQLLSENGLLGFIPVILLFIIICYVLLKDFIFNYFKGATTINDANLCLIICFFITLWPIVPTGSFYNNWLNILYYLPLSIYMYINFNEPETK